MSFELNQGQHDARVAYAARGEGYGLFLTRDGLILNLVKTELCAHGVQHAALASGKKSGCSDKAKNFRVQMGLAGANTNSTVEGEERLPGVANYLIGNDPERWRRNVPMYGKVKYGKVYPGVDMVFYGHEGQLEYDFVVAPGTDTKEIKLKFAGSERVSLEGNGDLRIATSEGAVAFHKPEVYQLRDGRRESVEGEFVIGGDGLVGFRIGKYDPLRALEIDPVLVYSTYLGGSGYYFGPANSAGYGDGANAIAVDSTGAAYVAGYTASMDFPVTSYLGGYGFEDGISTGFISKFSPDGTQLIYSSYLGSNPGVRQACADQTTIVYGIAVNAAGEAYVAGYTAALDFPLAHPFQSTPSRGFVSKISADGSSLLWSSYLGGSGLTVDGCVALVDRMAAIALDQAGNAYVTGAAFSSDFPLVHPFQSAKPGLADAFVTKIKADGSAIVWSSFLGGSGSPANQNLYDRGTAIAVDSGGNAYVAGLTYSVDFPTVNAMQSTLLAASSGTLAGSNIFVSEVKADGSALVFSTYLGGSVSDQAFGIAVNGGGSIAVTGSTQSPDFPKVKQVPTTQTAKGGMFIAKILAGGKTLASSSVLGNGVLVQNFSADVGNAVAMDAGGNMWFTGFTSGIVTVNPIRGTYTGVNGDAFVAEMKSDGSSLLFSSYLGGQGHDVGSGIAVDKEGGVYIAGETSSPDFPVLNAYLKGRPNNFGNAFVTKISGAVTGEATQATLTSNVNPQTPGQYVLFTATVTQAGVPVTYGTVNFVVDGAIASTATLSSTGTATYKAATLTAGQHKVYAIFAGGPDSNTSTSSTLTEVLQYLAPALPTFSLKSGTYMTPQAVSISDATAGAALYYTVTGKTPTVGSSVYTKPIPLNAPLTIKAFAVVNGVSSTVATASYVINLPPTVSPRAVTNLTSTGATLNGMVSDQGIAATAWFVYGTSKTALTLSTPKLAVPAAAGSQEVSQGVTGLTSGTTYYYQQMVSSAGGAFAGGVGSFTTP